MTYGYARVSSRDQNEARQLDALHAGEMDANCGGRRLPYLNATARSSAAGGRW